MVSTLYHIAFLKYDFMYNIQGARRWFEKSIETQYNVSGQVESVTKQETTHIYSGHDNHGYPTKLEVKLKDGDNAAKTVSQSKFENTYARR